MADAMLEKGREGVADGTIVFPTDTMKIALLDLGTADTAIKAVTGATNATPIVVTATAHGFTNGDIVNQGAILGNLAANGVFKIANTTANTYELTDPITGTNIVGSGAYTSGGYAVCLGPSAAGDNLDDYDAALVGTAQTLAGKSVTGGVYNATNPAFAATSGNSVEAVLIYKDTGTASTSRGLVLIDGRQIVTVAAAPTGTYTVVAVERLRGGIPNGTVLTFSNGQAVTLNAAANAGDRTITVVSTAVALTAGSRADAPYTGAGLPVTPNGGTINLSFDPTNHILKL